MAAPNSSLSRWHRTEGRLDRWASVGALAVGLVALVVFVLIR